MRDATNRKLNELSFSDLYVEVEDENYPNIKGAIKKMSQIVRIKKTWKYSTEKKFDETNQFGATLMKGSMQNQNFRRHHS